MEGNYLSNKELVNRLKEDWKVGKDYLIRDKEEKVVSKWYLEKWGRRIWYPSLDDPNIIIRLKKTWVKIEDKWEKYFNQMLETTKKLKEAGGKAHGKPLHDFKEKEEPNLYWLWETCEYEGILSFTWKWERNPTKLLNPDLGQKLSEQYHYCYHTIAKRSLLFKSALQEMIKNKLPDPRKLKLGTKYIIKIEDLYFYYIIESSPVKESRENIWETYHFSHKPPNILEIRENEISTRK